MDNLLLQTTDIIVKQERPPTVLVESTAVQLTAVHPKLPMRNKQVTLDYYRKLGFQVIGQHDYPHYLMLAKDRVELHFFLFEDLEPDQNDGQVYLRTDDIDALFEWVIAQKVAIHPNGTLSTKPWGQREFSLLDPDKNLLTFGQAQ